MARRPVFPLPSLLVGCVAVALGGCDGVPGQAHAAPGEAAKLQSPAMIAQEEKNSL